LYRLEFKPFEYKKHNPDYVTLQYDIVLHESGKAMLIAFSSTEEWIPYSQSDIIDETYSLIQVPYWLARKKNLLKHNIDREEIR